MVPVCLEAEAVVALLPPLTEPAREQRGSRLQKDAALLLLLGRLGNLIGVRLPSADVRRGLLAEVPDLFGREPHELEEDLERASLCLFLRPEIRPLEVLNDVREVDLGVEVA